MQLDKVLRPQQELFLASYTNPKSDTFGNAYKSALHSGYSEEYSQNITGQLPDWLSEYISDFKMLRKAERALDKTLEDDYDSEEIIINGLPSGFKKREPTLSKIKQDSAKFIAERLGKKKYSSRSEITDGEGKAIQGNTIVFNSFKDETDSKSSI